MKTFNHVVDDGTPFLDFIEDIKAAFSQRFVFHIDDFMSFVLREVCISYDATAVGNARLPLAVEVQVVSSRNQYMPVPVSPYLFSSPCENYRAGVLNEDAQGQRKQPIIFNFPCDKGDDLLVTVSGAAVGFNVGCMITGRKYGDS